MTSLSTPDYGMLSFIAYPIAEALERLFGVFGNYGFAIIAASLLLRFAILPLQLRAMRASEKMAKLQPKLLEIKQTYAGDRTRIHTETMLAMREAGVNPFLSMLPSLLQLPFFLAFYRVLRSLTALRLAPFVGWIKDLSMPDPFLVLPIMLGISFYLQQRFVPTPNHGTQPEVQQMMRYMPIVFGLLMLKVPAGLALYSLTGSFFQIAIGRSRKQAQKPPLPLVN